MNNQFKKITLEAEEGICYEVRETAGEVCIRAISILSQTTEKVGDFTNPQIPERYSHIENEWNEGLVIADGNDNRYVWDPTGSFINDILTDVDDEYLGIRLKDGSVKILKFAPKESFLEYKQTVKYAKMLKRGGFFSSQYNLSEVDGKIKSVAEVMPKVNIRYTEANECAERLSYGNVKSELLHDAEYSLILIWLYISGDKTESQLISDSTNWGNYWNSENSPKEVVPTGSKIRYYAKGFADIAGNIDTWLKRTNVSSKYPVAGGNFNDSGYSWTAGERCLIYDGDYSNVLGCRASLSE